MLNSFKSCACPLFWYEELRSDDGGYSLFKSLHNGDSRVFPTVIRVVLLYLLKLNQPKLSQDILTLCQASITALLRI